MLSMLLTATSLYASPGRSTLLHHRRGHWLIESPPSFQIAFDDGPDKGSPSLYSYLSTESISATHFLIGRRSFLPSLPSLLVPFLLHADTLLVSCFAPFFSHIPSTQKSSPTPPSSSN